MLSLVSNILPPLSSGDVNKLSNLLPLLAAALENGNLPSRDDPLVKDATKQCFSTCSELANFALNAEYEAQSRGAAADCLHAYIINFADRKYPSCTSKLLLLEVVVPSMISASKELQAATQKQGSKSAIALCKLVDSLNLCSTIVSSAAQVVPDSSSAHAFAFFALHH